LQSMITNGASMVSGAAAEWIIEVGAPVRSAE
jgi:hypothetical protein